MSEQQANNDQGVGLPFRWQFAVACLLLGAFAVIAIVMIINADGDETHWQRQVYVFGAVEAMVFTAVGWIFGREVHRSTAETASKNAADAAKDAERAREEKAAADVRAAEAEAKGRAVQTMVHSLDVAQPPYGARDVAAGRPDQPTLAVTNLRAFIDELYR